MNILKKEVGEIFLQSLKCCKVFKNLETLESFLEIVDKK
jgi:galactose-1-phosphate uridylyltransferase